ncbi:MAG: NAD(P)-binding domain-containing protein [Rhodospirillaceae bacterium]|nr:NAD(P)-binding domain-containing protein [Rhodospirillaceae bacterium]
MSQLTRRTAVGIAATVALASGAAAAPTKNAAIKPELIAIIGTGNVGAALGKRWGALGHKVVYGSRTPEAEKTKLLARDSGRTATAMAPRDAVKDATVVVLAVPAQAALETVAGLGDLKGKVIIDAMNEMSIENGKLIEPSNPAALSARIQAMAPDAQVVKALNATSSRAMADPAMTGGPITIPIAGASADAKAKVAALLKSIGLEAFDLGGADALKAVEHLGRVYVAYSASHRPQRMEFGFRTWSSPPG